MLSKRLSSSAALALRQQPRRLKTHGQWQTTVREHRPGNQTGLQSARGALPQRLTPMAKQARRTFTAARTDKSLRPAHLSQLGLARPSKRDVAHVVSATQIRSRTTDPIQQPLGPR